MRIYVAFRTDEDPPTRMAEGSFNKLRGRMKGTHAANGKKLKKPISMVGAEFTVAEYNFKPNLTNVCQAVADITEMDAESATSYRINEQNHLREIKDEED
jgi:hypothetical protein